MEKVPLVLYPPLQSPCILCDQGPLLGRIFTLYHYENTWKALASKGFLDIATFMALQGIQVQVADESAGLDVLEVDAGMCEVEHRAVAPLCPPGI